MKSASSPASSRSRACSAGELYPRRTVLILRVRTRLGPIPTTATSRTSNGARPRGRQTYRYAFRERALGVQVTEARLQLGPTPISDDTAGAAPTKLSSSPTLSTPGVADLTCSWSSYRRPGIATPQG